MTAGGTGSGGSLRSSIFRAIEVGQDPRELLGEVLGREPTEFTQPTEEIWRILFKFAYYQDIRRRSVTRPKFTDIESVINLIQASTKIVVILGAGGSVGPDFRSPGGLYDSIAKEGLLEDPSDVFDIDYYRQDRSIFWRFAHTVFPSENPQHSGTHWFIKDLNDHGKLLRVYSQNIDALEVGIPDEKLRCVHGSWRDTRCMSCGEHYSIDDIRPFVLKQEEPCCKQCGGPLKPGIVFFGESTLLDETELEMDAAAADLLVVVGTSLRVAPVSEIPYVFHAVPALLINRASVKNVFSAELLGECDDVTRMLKMELGWTDDAPFGAGDATVFGNKFIFPSDSPLATRVCETACGSFLATSVPVDVDDLL